MKTLVVGLAHFVDKYGYQSKIFQENGCQIRFLSTDVSNSTNEKANEYKADVVISGQGVFDRLKTYTQQLVDYKPDWLELYDVGRLTLVYFILAKILRVKVQVYIIGYELRASHQSDKYTRVSWIFKQVLLKFVLRHSDIVCVKEISSLEIAKNYVSKGRLLHLHNCVPMPKRNKVEKYYDFAFINAVERVRHVISFVKAVEEVYQKNTNLKVLIAGFTSLDNNSHFRDVEYEKAVIDYINNSPANKCFEIKGFVSNTGFYLDRTRYFVFPSDVVFANYTLLEAMSRGVVPIVYNGEGCEKIVRHNNTGFVFHDINRMGETLNIALDFPLKEYNIVSENAMSLIENKFSIDNWFDIINERRNKNIN